MADIVTQITDYLDNPTPSGSGALAQFGDAVIPLGLIIITQKLKRLGADMVFESIKQDISWTETIEQYGTQWLDEFCLVLAQIGEKSVDGLLPLLDHQDHDVRALAAILLFISPLKGFCHVDSLMQSRQKIENRYQRTKRTGVRIALAALLSTFGDLLKIKSLAVPYLVDSQEKLFILFQNYQRQVPSDPIDITEFAVLAVIAQSSGIRVILWDIASGGSFPAYKWKDWVRSE